MATIQATKVPIDIDALAEAARREPLHVMSGDRAALVVVEPERFRRLVAAEKALLGSEADPVIRAARATQRTAAEAGLGETELARLLADES